MMVRVSIVPSSNQMGNVFIVENKSLAAYLRQLDTMGENIEEYATLWYYTKERRNLVLKIYEYPSPFVQYN